MNVPRSSLDNKNTYTHIQAFFVDGYKVTVRYNTQGSPDAIKNIQSILLSNLSCKSGENLHK